MIRFSSAELGAVLAVCASCVAVGFGAGSLAAAKSAMIVTPIDQANFQPVDPAQPARVQIAVLRGDPATGPSSMLFRFPSSAGRMHVHSSDYDLVLVKGKMKHWVQGQSPEQVPTLEPGSYWFQPGNEPHVDECLSDECLMYVQWSGKRDARPVETR
jgi:quercetin dioxygenase-like cupin family protein